MANKWEDIRPLTGKKLEAILSVGDNELACTKLAKNLGIEMDTDLRFIKHWSEEEYGPFHITYKVTAECRSGRVEAVHCQCNPWRPDGDRYFSGTRDQMHAFILVDFKSHCQLPSAAILAIKETTLAGVRVDGDAKITNQVFEFHGCYFHECPVCITQNSDKYLHDNPIETVESHYYATGAETERLRTMDYELIEKWECDFRRELDRNREMRKYLENYILLTNLPLDSKDAFYGGRTDGTKLYRKVGPREEIKYVGIVNFPCLQIKG
ncbi:hypothetical protein NQ318_001697 [Aromia moschata]|uniref:Uncharacterized protein n=1 Tax=Aromia moschata TaxID=1265417 RepID=A0AAV8Y488_9CUCU|nr:hypothetical protein NQ318_001697 [Aromia moschata]